MADLPEYQSIWDGPQIDEGIGKIVNGEIDAIAARAEASAKRSESAEQAVKKAINSIPPGATLVIDDLTTGGSAAALSAEQGKILEEKKADRSKVYTKAESDAFFSGKANLDPYTGRLSVEQAPTLSEVGGSGQNLVINGQFGLGVVNQRGKTEYHGDGYCVDGWVLSNRLSAALMDGFLRIRKNELAYNPLFSQRMENFAAFNGKTLTVSMLYRSTYQNGVRLVANPNRTTGQMAINVPPASDWTLITETFIAAESQTEKSYFWVQFMAAINTLDGYLDIKALKLEAGPTSTLLNDPPQDYGTELAKCQRYLLRLIDPAVSGQKYLATGIATSTASFYALMPTPVTMRASPVAIVSFAAGSLLAYGAVNGALERSIPVTSLSVFGKSEHGIILKIDSANAFTSGNTYTVYTTNPVTTQILFSAEL